MEIKDTGTLVQIYELFYNVCGVLPPVNNIGYHERNETNVFPDCWGGVHRAHALFKGIERPMIDSGLDREVFTYVVKPPYRYNTVNDMVCMAKRETVPNNQLFVVLVVKEGETFEISNWMWLLSDPDDNLLPKGYTKRYETRIW